MNEYYRQTLIRLRCEVNIMRDSALVSVRSAAERMLAVIDSVLTAPPPELPTMPQPAVLSNSDLMRELTKRLQAPRHLRKVCSKCNNMPSRARGLCKRCYKRAYRRGELIKNQLHSNGR